MNLDVMDPHDSNDICVAEDYIVCLNASESSAADASSTAPCHQYSCTFYQSLQMTQSRFNI